MNNFNTDIQSLMDTGSSRTYLDSAGLDIIKCKGIKVDFLKSSAAIMATGAIESIIGEANLPITFSGTIRPINVKIIPSLTDTCVLGMDFSQSFEIIMHLRGRQLWSADELIVKFAFGLPADNESEVCEGIAIGFEEGAAKTIFEKITRRVIHQINREMIVCHLE